jgi:hypothetical protein
VRFGTDLWNLAFASNWAVWPLPYIGCVRPSLPAALPPRHFRIESATFAYRYLFEIVWILMNVVPYVVAMVTELKDLAP